jgi:glycosyltransferase involved in cell wall biosynthesis
MKILHICSDYAKQSIYNQLVTHLSLKGVNQEVYVPVRTESEIGKNINAELKNVNYVFSFLLNKWDRINYFGKIKKVEKDVISKVELKNVDLIHAHFLFSDGGVAYRLYKEFGIPYVVTVRNTDINIFFKYFIHLRPFAHDVLRHASQVVFLSPKYKEFTFGKYISKLMRNDLSNKTSVIPNGVNPYWLKNIHEKTKVLDSEKINFLYVGDFSKNKNIQLSIEALKIIQSNLKNISFKLVGGGGDYDSQIRELVSNNSDWIEIMERTNDIEELKEQFEKADVFLMPSKFETFGLVYIEALSQGLPVIFTEGQGVDGFFEDGEVGYAIKPNSIDDYVSKILKIIKNYSEITLQCNKKAGKFSWVDISKDYVELYSKFIK